MLSVLWSKFRRMLIIIHSVAAGGKEEQCATESANCCHRLYVRLFFFSVSENDLEEFSGTTEDVEEEMSHGCGRWHESCCSGFG